MPSGPKPSITFLSKDSHKNLPAFFKGVTKTKSYNSSKYHLFSKKL